MCKAGVAQGTANTVDKFLKYGLGSGQDVLARLDYAKLPASLLAKASVKVAKLTCNGGPLTG
jgi:hypothetical protein